MQSYRDEKAKRGASKFTIALLSFSLTSTLFLGVAVYMQSNQMMLINTNGITVASAEKDWLTQVSER